MRTSNRLTLMLLVSLGFAAYSTTATAAPVKISACQKISQSGSFMLVKNLTATGDCIVLTADFITIDLSGFTITGNGKGVGISTVEDSRRGISVSNGNITGFYDGVEMRNARDVTLDRVRVTDNAHHGIRIGLSGTPGMTSNVIIKNCVVIKNGSNDIVTTRSVVSENIIGKMTAANSTTIGNYIDYLDADHGLVVSNVGHNLFVGNCPALIKGNNFDTLTAGDPPFIFNKDCKVIENIPGALTSP
jgi:hypothetical protein